MAAAFQLGQVGTDSSNMSSHSRQGKIQKENALSLGYIRFFHLIQSILINNHRLKCPNSVKVKCATVHGLALCASVYLSWLSDILDALTEPAPHNQEQS